MELISSDEVRGKFTDIWPSLKFMVLSDSLWAPPFSKELMEVVDAYQGSRKPEYNHRVFECEEFSIDLMAFMRRFNAQNAQDHNWPFGIVCGTRFAGVDIDHWCNVALCRDESLLLLEPQTGRMWTPNRTADNIYFVLM